MTFWSTFHSSWCSGLLFYTLFIEKRVYFVHSYYCILDWHTSLESQESYLLNDVQNEYVHKEGTGEKGRFVLESMQRTYLECNNTLQLQKEFLMGSHKNKPQLPQLLSRVCKTIINQHILTQVNLCNFKILRECLLFGLSFRTIYIPNAMT